MPRSICRRCKRIDGHAHSLCAGRGLRGTGTGTGTVSFADHNTKVSTTGGVSIFYNPTSYMSPTEFGAYNVVGGVPTAYMLVKDLTDRDRILPLARAQKAAKALGMREIAETA